MMQNKAQSDVPSASPRTHAEGRAYLRDLEKMPVERRRRAEVATMQHAVLFLLLHPNTAEWDEAFRQLRRLVREFDADGTGFWYELRVIVDRYAGEPDARQRSVYFSQLRRAALAIYAGRARSALSAWSSACDDSLRLVESDARRSA